MNNDDYVLIDTVELKQLHSIQQPGDQYWNDNDWHNATSIGCGFGQFIYRRPWHLIDSKDYDIIDTDSLRKDFSPMDRNDGQWCPLKRTWLSCAGFGRAFIGTVIYRRKKPKASPIPDWEKAYNNHISCSSVGVGCDCYKGAFKAGWESNAK